jgi:hypothetical protein
MVIQLYEYSNPEKYKVGDVVEILKKKFHAGGYLSIHWFWGKIIKIKKMTHMYKKKKEHWNSYDVKTIRDLFCGGGDGFVWWINDDDIIRKIKFLQTPEVYKSLKIELPDYIWVN